MVRKNQSKLSPPARRLIAVIAGHDTTAAGLTWLFCCLARHPPIAALVHQELDAILGGREPNANDLPQLSYTERVVKETLRLYPPAIAVYMRQTMADVEIADHTLPRNSLVQLFPYICQRDSRWFPEPERFDPDRFLPERQQSLPPFAYFPFGGGPRVCIGNTFAQMEMTLVAATLLQRLRVELAVGQEEAQPVPLMSLRPKGEASLDPARNVGGCARTANTLLTVCSRNCVDGIRELSGFL